MNKNDLVETPNCIPENHDREYVRRYISETDIEIYGSCYGNSVTGYTTRMCFENTLFFEEILA